MPRTLAFHAAALAALMLIAAGCDQQPTEVQEFRIDGVAFSYIGFEGDADDAPQSATSVEHSEAFPSTNVANIAAGWANVTWNSNDAGLGEAPLKFVQPRNFAACFEIRTDGEAPVLETHNNAHIADGKWKAVCVGGTHPAVLAETFRAANYVDIRLSYGAETDERFDWTRFYVMGAESKDQCQDGGWQAFGFANQGHCIRYIVTGKR